MTHKTHLQKVGNSLGVVLPEEALAYLKVSEGDELCLTEMLDGGLLITPANAQFDRQMEVAKEVVTHYRNTLRNLAD